MHTQTGVIQVEIRNVYGQQKIYPVCDTAVSFATIAGTLTLKPDHIRIIKSLGYQVNVVSPTVTL